MDVSLVFLLLHTLVFRGLDITSRQAALRETLEALTSSPAETHYFSPVVAHSPPARQHAILSGNQVPLPGPPCPRSAPGPLSAEPALGPRSSPAVGADNGEGRVGRRTAYMRTQQVSVHLIHLPCARAVEAVG